MHNVKQTISEQVLHEMAQMKRLGMRVPAKAMKLAANNAVCEDYYKNCGMNISEIVSWLIEEASML